MSLKNLLVTFFCINLFSVYSQDLEDVFEDPQSDLTANIGTSVFFTCFGVPNLDADCRLRDNRVVVNGGFGVIPFGFLYNDYDPFKIYNLGTMSQISLNFRVAHDINYKGVDVFVGPKIQYVQFTGSKNSEIAQMKEHQYFENTGPSELAFSRRYLYYGVNVTFIQPFLEKFSYSYGVSFGFSNRNIKYDQENSSNIDWSSSAPSGWFKEDQFNLFGQFHFNIYFKAI